MPKFLLSLLLVFSVTLCFSQEYYFPYIKIDNLLNRRLKSFVVEAKSAEKDSFFVFQKEESKFIDPCLSTGYKRFDRNNSQGQLSEADSDTIIYENGNIKELITFFNKKPATKYTFKRNLSQKTDTTFTQFYDNSNTLLPLIQRSILYKNSKGLDSLYTTELKNNSTWKQGNDYHQFFYNDKGLRTKAIIGNYFYVDANNSVYARTQTSIYEYSGNNLILQIDSMCSNPSATNSKIDRIMKTEFKYDNLNRLTERTNQMWMANTNNAFTFIQRKRVTSFNAQNKESEVYFDTWTNNAWAEDYKSTISYSNNNLTYLEFAYKKIDNVWILGSKITSQFCGTTSASKEVEPLKFSVYPNPAQNYLYVLSPDLEQTKSTVQIFNNLGYMVLQQKDSLYPYSIDISNLSNGFYYLKITNENNRSAIQKISILR